MIVVSDASPLISLAVIGHLNLLQHLYTDVIIPEAVRSEELEANEDAPGVAQIISAPGFACVP